MMRRSLTNLCLLALGITVLSAAPVYAQQCDETGHGAPGVSNVGANNSGSGFTVFWILQCTLHPDKIEVRQGGTSQEGWQDGALLGSISLAPLMNGGTVAASNLSANSQYLHLRLCSIYLTPDFESWCSDEFGAFTGPPSPGLPVPPTDLAVTIKPQAAQVFSDATLSWHQFNFAGTATLTTTPALAHNTGTTISVDSNVSHDYTTFFNNLVGSATYMFSICNENSVGRSCATVSAKTLPQPPAPPIPFAVDVKAVLVGPGHAHISWTLVTSNPAISFVVQRQILIVDPSATLGLRAGKFLPISGQLPGGDTSYDDLAVVKGIINVFRVCGQKLNFTVCSNPSNRIVGN